MYYIKQIKDSDKPWVRKISIKYYGGKFCVFLGRKFFMDKLPGFFAEDENQKKLGLTTFEFRNNFCEIMTLNAFKKFNGIGTKLLKKVIKISKEKKFIKIKVVTTNDNLDALRFYQKRGFQILKIYKNTSEKDRKIKPSLPKKGDYGILIKDAIELEYLLNKKS